MEDLNNPTDVATHIRDTKESLAEIEHDIHCLMDMEKKEVEDMTEGFDSGMLAGLLSRQGVDPSIVAMLNDCRKDGNWGDGGMLIVLFLILILGFGGNGGWFGNRNGAGAAEAAGIDRTIFNQSNFENLASAINTQGTRQEMAIQSLANNLNCDVNSIRSALCGLDKQLAITNGNVINAIQSCCCNIQNKVQECCCTTQRVIENQGAQTRELLQDNRFLIQSTSAAQNNLVQSLFCQQNQLITDKFNALELRDLQRDLDNKNAMINDLKFQLSQEQQTTALLTALRGMNDITFSGTAGATAFNGTGSIS